jgi:hypothetical protein
VDRLIGIDELSTLLGIPKATLYDWRKRRSPDASSLARQRAPRSPLA